MKMLNTAYGVMERVQDLLGRFTVNGTTKQVESATDNPSIQSMLADNISNACAAACGSAWVPGGIVRMKGTSITTYATTTELNGLFGYDASAVTTQPFSGVTQAGNVVMVNQVFNVSHTMSEAVSTHMFWRSESAVDTGSERQFIDGTNGATDIIDIVDDGQFEFIESAAPPSQLLSKPTWLYLGYFHNVPMVGFKHYIPISNTSVIPLALY